MTNPDQKDSVRRLYEGLIGQNHLELLDELVAVDAKDHNAAARGWGDGREAFRIHVAFFQQAFRDLNVTVDDLLAEDDRVVAFWSFRGVHSGEIWGVAPTGRTIEAHTVSILRFRNGQIVEYESRPDRLGLLVQLGAAGQYAARLNETR